MHSACFNRRTHTGCDINELYGVNKFKSIKVRLKLTPSVHCQMCPKFQFHKGPIKAAMAQASVWGEPCFNSIKVRLKQDAVDFVLNANYFQFHKGPIKTYCFIRANAAVLRFQFHEGPIKTNSTFANRIVFIVFQFHEGPIKTGSVQPYRRRVVRFNSMKVRLKQGRPIHNTAIRKVSIP